jgi:uncharacterized protein
MPSLALFTTAIYTILLSLIYLALTIIVIRNRWKHKVPFLDGGIDPMTRAIRAHGNFIEYVPLCLMLMAFSELNGAPFWALLGFGAILTLSRLMHAYGVINASLKMRINAMTATLFCLLSGSVLLFITLLPL